MYQQLHDPAFLAVASGGTPALDLFFSATKTLDSRITFSRGSSGTFINSSGLVETAASGVARFTHNPSTLASLGLLIEESRTNLLLRSEEIDNASWVKLQTSITANAAIAPDGTNTADKLIATGSGGTHQVRQTVSGGNTRYTFSVFVKRADANQNVYLEAGNARVTVDAATGATLYGPDTFSTGWSAASVQTTAFGNGWFRVALSATADATVTSVECEIYNSIPTAGAAGNIAFTGDGVSGIFIWGAQLEAGSFATSYIPTTSATVTRAADVATMTGTNFSSWFNATEGTFVSEIQKASAGVPWSISNGTLFNRLHPDGVSQRGYAQISSTAESGVFGFATAVGLVAIKEAIAYKTASYFYANSLGATGSASFVGVPSVSQMQLGNIVTASQYSGTIARIRYFRRRLPNANLQTLTT